MGTHLIEKENSIVLKNRYIAIEISKQNAAVLSCVYLQTGADIMGEKIAFFEVLDHEENPHAATSVSLENDVLLFASELGMVSLKVDASEDWFVFEIVDANLDNKAFYVNFARAKFTYDTEDDNAIRVTDVPMTIQTRTFSYPDGLSREIGARVYPHLGGVIGARVGVASVPEKILRETLKIVCAKIDPEKGLVSKTAGPWALDHKRSFGDYTIAYDATPEVVEKAVQVYKASGVDQVDYHQGPTTFRQGDFKYMTVSDHAEFCEKVSGFLKKNGLETGLHTYAYYINPECHEMLSDPRWQAQLDRFEEWFTLAEDIEADADFVPTEQSTAQISDYFGFFVSNIPYILIEEEIIRFTNDAQGFKAAERGACGTKPVAHKKGVKVIRLRGCFNLLAPAVDTDLFKKIAHNTAQMYNEGGFAMIYLDALDGITRHCTEHETWYYAAVFVHEIVKNCKTSPIIEYSTMYPSIWSARARMGAWDHPYRGYKGFNTLHDEENKTSMRRHYACTLGWYGYYPTTDEYPGNQHTKYHHLDAVDHMGALAVMNNYSTVFNPIEDALLKRYAGFRRNIARYKFYSDIRKSDYFSKETLEKAKANPHEKHIVQKGEGEYAFIEKNYQTKRLYDVMDEQRNTAVFSNPFDEQTPFIRLEADMSTLGADAFVLLPLDENKPIAEQAKTYQFDSELDLRKHMAMTVRVKGNGKKGAVALRLKCASQSEFGYGVYIIDTDFEGWRDFVLLEADNSDRPDLPFEGDRYGTYRSGLNMDRITAAEVMVAGDVEDVRVSSILACRQIYNVIKNPTVTMGEQSVMFECELMSTDFIEWDGKEAKVIDRYGNEKGVWCAESTLVVPQGQFEAKVTAVDSLNGCPINVHLTFGLTGKEINADYQRRSKKNK